MQPRKLKVGIVIFAYGGNGGTAAVAPGLMLWLVDTVMKMKADPRIETRIERAVLSDTPITMSRNMSIEWARKLGVDVLLMLDNDNVPDCEADFDPLARPFWDTSFNFLCKHYDKGPVVVFAPYCGGPPHENVYVFKAAALETDNPNVEFRLAQYTREEAQHMGGIQQVAAAPTGCIIYDTRVFDVLDEPHFYYEYEKDGAPCVTCGQRHRGPESAKGSTEDVVTTRNMSFNAQLKLGYNPVYCNWDAWAGHWKPKLVRKPRLPTFDTVEKSFRNAVQRGKRFDEQLMMIGEPTPFVTDEEMAVELAKVNGPSANGHTNGCVTVTEGLGNGRVHLIGEPSGLQMTNEWANANLAGHINYHVTDDGFIHVGMATPDCDTAALKELGRIVGKRCLADGYMSVRGVEIGSWVGATAKAMIEGLIEGGSKDPRLYCVDTWMGSSFDRTRQIVEQAGGDLIWKTFQQNLHAEIRGKIVWPMRMRSTLAALDESMENAELDCIFIDAGHTYGELLTDLKTWFPKLGPRGIICGHDYHTSGFPGVTQAVDEFFGGRAKQVGSTAIWVFDAGQFPERELASVGSESGPGIGSPDQPSLDSQEPGPAGISD